MGKKKITRAKLREQQRKKQEAAAAFTVTETALERKERLKKLEEDADHELCDNLFSLCGAAESTGQQTPVQSNNSGTPEDTHNRGTGVLKKQLSLKGKALFIHGSGPADATEPKFGHTPADSEMFCNELYDDDYDDGDFM